MSNKNTTETAARPGRKPSFPGQVTVAFLSNIPVATRDMLREVAEARQEPINVTLARMIERGHKDATRRRKSGANANG